MMSRGDLEAIRVILLFSVVFVAFHSFFQVDGAKRMKTMWHRQYGECPEHDDIVHTRFIEAKIVSLEQGKTVITTRAEVLKPIKEITKITVKIKRCASFADQGSCENFYNFAFTNICDMMKLKGQLWSGIMELMEPPEYRHCPFKPGNFSIVNATFDPNLLAAIVPGLEGYYWRIEARGFEKKKAIGCILYGGEVRMIRV